MTFGRVHVLEWRNIGRRNRAAMWLQHRIRQFLGDLKWRGSFGLMLKWGRKTGPFILSRTRHWNRCYCEEMALSGIRKVCRMKESCGQGVGRDKELSVSELISSSWGYIANTPGLALHLSFFYTDEQGAVPRFSVITAFVLVPWLIALSSWET